MTVWLRALDDGQRAAVDEANLHMAAAGFGRLHASRLPAPSFSLHQLLGKATFLTLLIHLHALCLLVAWAAVNSIHRVEVRFVCEATAQGWNVGLGREKCLHDTNLIRWLRARHRVPRSFTYIHHSFHVCVEQRC
jgi:hypothetical protein